MDRKVPRKKLELRKQTLQHLTEEEIEQVAGGRNISSDCGPTQACPTTSEGDARRQR